MEKRILEVLIEEKVFKTKFKNYKEISCYE